MSAKRRSKPRRRGSAQRRSDRQRNDMPQTPSTPTVEGDSFRYDYYAFLAKVNEPPELVSPSALATRWIVGTRNKPRRDHQQRLDYRNNTRRDHQQRRDYRNNTPSERYKSPFAIIEELKLNVSPSPSIKGWFALDVDFRLQRPWYSKDDVNLHVLDNPVRKDRVFGAPFMDASSWRGLLRWACRMEDEIRDDWEEPGKSIDKCADQNWIIHLFGNSAEKDEEGTRGALAFRPTWFDDVGFELINPHSRYRNDKDGTKNKPNRPSVKPIIFEVVPPNTLGTLQLLYAPLREYPRQCEKIAFQKLLSAIEKLLTVYGFSAKRSFGWGLAEILGWRLRWGDEARELGSREEVLDLMHDVRGWKGER